jgi:hypothetical protein
MGRALIQLPSFEGGDARLATVPTDNGANGLDYAAPLQALDGHPFRCFVQFLSVD